MKLNRQVVWLLDELWIRKTEFVTGLLCIAASAGLYLLLPRWASYLVQTVFPSGSVVLLAQHLALGLLIFLLASVLTFWRTYLMMHLTHAIATATREQIFRHVLRVSPRLLQSFGGGNLLSAFSNDLNTFQLAVTGLIGSFVPSAILFLCFGAAMAWHSVLLFCATILLLSPLVWVIVVVGKRVRLAVHGSQDGLAKVLGRFEELISCAKEIKSFGREETEIKRFKEVSGKAFSAILVRDWLDAFHPAAVSLSVAIAVGALILLSAFLIGEDLITVETLTAFLVCALLAYPALQETCNSAGRLMQFRAVAERIERIFALPVEEEGAQPLANKRIAGAVKFERLSFGYETGSFRLKDFDLDVKAGQMVALIGPSGAGKSTILDFIPRFLAPHSGRVLINGQDIATVRLSDLRRQIGVVPQEPILFEATIEENLRFGAPDASEDEVLSAARAAHVDEFVQLMPGRYGARVESRGRNLSVGQRQRIAIARVFLKNPRILLFDEPTSALDGASERLVRDAVRNAAAGRTTLIVAHRMSTVRDADRILVIEHGRIVEDGTHKDLFELRGLYHSLYSAQSEGATKSSAPQAA